MPYKRTLKVDIISFNDYDLTFFSNAGTQKIMISRIMTALLSGKSCNESCVLKAEWLRNQSWIFLPLLT